MIVLRVRNGNFLLTPTVCPENTTGQHVPCSYTIKIYPEIVRLSNVNTSPDMYMYITFTSISNIK